MFFIRGSGQNFAIGVAGPYPIEIVIIIKIGSELEKLFWIYAHAAFFVVHCV